VRETPGETGTSSRNSRRILGLVGKDQPERDIGRYAGWGAGDDLTAPSKHEREGPSLFPLAYRDDRVWRRTLGCLWLPAMVVLITVEDWLRIPQGIGWISLVGLFVAFIVVARWGDRKNA
jgi:hypothetical protein